MYVTLYECYIMDAYLIKLKFLNVKKKFPFSLG